IGREPASQGRGALGYPREHRHSASDEAHGGPQYVQFLRIFQRTIFADRAQQDQSVHSSVEQTPQVAGGRCHVEALISLELSRDRGENTFPVYLHGLIPPVPTVTAA